MPLASTFFSKSKRTLSGGPRRRREWSSRSASVYDLEVQKERSVCDWRPERMPPGRLSILLDPSYFSVVDSQ